jgi:hypothetical protein
VVAAALTGCSSQHPHRDAAITPTWHRGTLPVPAGSRAAARDAVFCGGRWYVAGGTVAADGSTAPALWTALGSSARATTWQSVPIAARDSYARESVLYTVGCREGRVAAIGAKTGGAHGNPRSSSWVLRPDGTLVDVIAPFVLFAGADALSVSRIAGGGPGWIIAGSRRTGAAVWTSPDATAFTLRDAVPQLVSPPGGETTALDAVGDTAGWTVVGRGETRAQSAPEPLAWTSADGVAWTRQQVPAGGTGFADLERVISTSTGLVAAGIRGNRFATWTRTGGAWSAGPTFGRTTEGGTAPFVSGIAAVGSQTYVALSDGSRFGLWAHGHDGWRKVSTPIAPASNGDSQLTIAAHSGTVLLLANDGRSARVWTTSPESRHG